jgi:putative hydrolase of the HAD superfamily
MTDGICVVFDIDDTLYLERDYVHSGFIAAEAALNELHDASGFAAECWALFRAGTRGDTFNRVLRARTLAASPLLMQSLLTAYRSHRPEISLLEDARAALSTLVNTGAVAVVTDGPIESQRAKSAALGLDTWMELIVFTDEWGTDYRKPHCRAFEEVMRRIRVAPQRCVYVADNPVKDFVAPRSLGWRTVRVRRPDSLHHAVDSGEDVDIEVEDMTSLTEWLAIRP